MPEKNIRPAGDSSVPCRHSFGGTNHIAELTNSFRNFEFQFKVADLNFHSTEYHWLVVAGVNAGFNGVGTINGQGNYSFLISAIDKLLTPSTDADLFWIKIWNIDYSDTIVYDNLLGESDNANSTSALGGGSIVIQTTK